VLGLEVASQDHYDWKGNPRTALRKITLFPNRTYEQLTRGEIRKAVREKLDELGPDAVAINGWSVPEALVALRWAESRKRRRVLMSESFNPSRNFFKEWLKRRRICRFDSALVGGRWHYHYLTGHGFSPSKIFIGYDSVDNDFFQAPLQVESSSQPAYFLANCRFIERKNIDGLLQAYTRYHKVTMQHTPSAKPWSLVVVGDGDLREAWQMLANKLNIAQSVQWPGFVQYEDLPRLYRRAGCFVHVAHEEPWGLVVNEAAASGLPMIISDQVGATCELLEHGRNGWLVDSKNPESIAQAMDRIWRMPQPQWKQWGDHSRILVSRLSPQHFGIGLRAALELPASRGN
jgi:glycosyltransferase involved in cell wall biosynthesis